MARDIDPSLAYQLRKLRTPRTMSKGRNDPKDPTQYKKMKLDDYSQ